MTIAEIADLPKPPPPDPLPPPPAPPARTLITILVITVGWGAVSSALWLVHEGGGRLAGFDIAISDVQLIELLVFELAIGLSIVAYLRHRGWRLEHITRPPAGRDLLRGVGLWLGMILCVWAVTIVVLNTGPSTSDSLQATRLVGRLSWPLVAAVSLVNPVFEELLLLGFVAAGFYGAGAWRIGLLSIALRVIVHTYQGVHALLFVAPVGIVFAGYYLRTRRLGPVIVAHAIQDVIGLGVVAAKGGTT
jgi:uncharacterized protein